MMEARDALLALMKIAQTSPRGPGLASVTLWAPRDVERYGVTIQWRPIRRGGTTFLVSDGKNFKAHAPNGRRSIRREGSLLRPNARTFFDLSGRSEMIRRGYQDARGRIHLTPSCSEAFGTVQPVAFSEPVFGPDKRCQYCCFVGSRVETAPADHERRIPGHLKL